ncbi:hypothetical protein AB0P17_21030 [Streptomyces sp. NPDC088124]|uniref:hypothetical protein n=1 Tax=Streptomyces sp. NPDC088124 TaxID=3154654 RepID=UPI003417EC9C
MRIPSLLDLKIEQQATIDLPFHGNHVVTGSAGSGKTVLAIYRAWALTVTGRDVFLFTHSNPLHQYHAQVAPDLTEAVKVSTYHRWVRCFWNRHFETNPPSTDEEGFSYDWIEMQRHCIMRGFKSNAHLVIDEGQKLPVAFYQWCRIVGVDVTVYADENQRIDDDHSTLSEIRRALAVGTAPLALRENHRNTREIATLASEFRTDTGKESCSPTREGRTPTILRVPSLEYLLSGVNQYFIAHPQRSIGIVCRSKLVLREIQSSLTRLKLAKHTQAYASGDRYRDTIDFSTRSILVVNTASVKGLEFDSVFVPDLDAYTEDPTSVEARLRFFMLCTRAREDLYFAYRGPQEPPILSSVPDSLLFRHSD